ncbi:glycosyltransferase [Rhodococcus sp. Leaf278]|uniref:hypothetical protein n=1 Tax=Rhodococcus sp. Leaf278 TaxID=1736319 RepID=UPI0007109645|nr:hypothetical protein [Rhodococcus sp. Leaf278]KQU61490.1 glycosyltransferase [Rhodococcus sp. Leaf278]
MTENYPAFEVSPVPIPGPHTAAPELFRGLYGMPMFVTVPTANLAESTEFWTRALGFFELFTIPGQLVHLRRWVFQDVLLVPTERSAGLPAMTVSFACVLDQLDSIAQACAQIRPGSATGPHTRLWNSVELEIHTPENVQVIMTAARPYDPDSAEAATLRAVGIEPTEHGGP